MEYLHSLLKFAVNMGASDIHVKPDHHATIRISGELFPVQVDPPTKEQVEEIVRHMLPKHLEARLDREKEADFSYIDPALGRFRVNVFYQRGVASFAMRHVKTHVPSFKDLNLPEQMSKVAQAERGIILVTGPTGCGKSSTLAALVQHINETEKCHIITLEDPIEYIFEDKQSVIEQREVGLDTLSFERALVHVMRQDPDVIMIGEMRDSQSFMAALAAADTGHLVITTLHTTTAYSAIGRTLDFFPAHERDQIRRQIAANLRAVVCQRLVPAIAGSVVPAVEIMLNSPTVRKFIEQNMLDKLSAAVETGTDDGMQTFNQALYKLVKAKLITEEEALAKATNPEALKMNFRGIFLDESRRILANA
ncbi:MAG TPA: PilT/PilU family type 4a pilus ATPase [Verrucomicrobiae bacterium]|nr:PilT/PilU family type 4a pilus ATPase [Verrucomicrobiae bacterium]